MSAAGKSRRRFGGLRDVWQRRVSGTTRGFLNSGNMLFALSAGVGVVGGLAAVVFRWLTELIQSAFFGSHGGLLDLALALPPHQRVLIPMVGGLIAGLIVYYGLREGGGTGVSEIMEAVSLRGGEIKARPTLVRSASAMFSIGSGASIGREGPIVALAALLGGQVARFAGVARDHRAILIGCGVASGIAASYNAPIASALFVMEIIIGNFAMEVFGPLVFSSVLSTLIYRSVAGDAPLYKIPEFMLVHPAELAAYALLGVAAGIVSWLFMGSLAFFERWSQKLPVPLWLKVGLGGLAVGIIGIWYPHVWGNGYDAASRALNDQLPLQLLAVLLIAKILATSLTVASGASGGVFTPTLFVGAALGGVFGGTLHAVAPAVTAQPGAYALVGMGALLAATTHAPIMAILMIYEMSGSYSVILPLMLSCIFASLVARSLQPQSVYTEKLSKKGINWKAGLEEVVLRGLRVRDLMRSNVELLPLNLPFADIVTRFYGGRSNYLYVGDERGAFVGVVDLHDVKEHFADPELTAIIVANDVAVECPTVCPEDAVADILEDYWLREMGQLPVVSDPEKRQFLGIVRRVDLLAVLNREVLKKEMMLAKFVRRTEHGAETDYMELPEGYRLEVIAAPLEFAGKSLQALDLRQRFGVNVLAISRPSPAGRERVMAEPDFLLAPGDELVLVGRQEGIRAMLSSP